MHKLFNIQIHHTSVSLLAPVLSALTLRGLEVGFLLLLNGLRVVVGGAFVHGQRGNLLVGLAAVVAVVRLAWRVDHMVLVQAGVLSKALLTAGHGTHVWLFTCGNEPEVSKGQKGEAFLVQTGQVTGTDPCVSACDSCSWWRWRRNGHSWAQSSSTAARRCVSGCEPCGCWRW